mgnify:CR=1 FL=1
MSLPFDLTLFELIFIALLIFIGSSVQGILGFGFAVIASPIVVQIEALLVPQLLSLLGLPLAIRVFIRERNKVDLSSVKPLVAGRFVGGPIGLLFLSILNEKYLSISVGLIVFLAGLASGFWKNISDLNDLWTEDKSFNPNLKNDSSNIINLWEIRINKLLKVNE